MKRRRVKRVSCVHYIFLGFCALIILVPFVWLLMTAFKDNGEFMMRPYQWPQSFSLDNFAAAWRTINMPRLFKNSAIITVISVILIVVFAAMAAYTISRFRLKINKLLSGYFLLGMMIPLNAAIIPLFLTMRNLHLTNSYAGVIISYVAFNMPISIYLVSNYMRGIPDEIEESAVIDGCGIARLFIRIILPLARPICITVAIMIFMQLWNEFQFALIFLPNESYYTLPIGLSAFRGQYSTDYGVMVAGMTIAAIPTLVVYFSMSDLIMKGMTAGAVKG